MRNNFPVTNQEQSAGIEQVTQTSTKMDDITQQNATLVEQAAASTERSKTQAISLRELVNAFTLVKSDKSSVVARHVTSEMTAYIDEKKRISEQISQILIANQS
ncbi:hypothetical protein UNDKW_4485 [Undibacterium sp. KW1]|uniref:hypothetical protein n=1 Tax=Undibacterium sp. KW1 TaxID=2058624 RepID=UPI001331D37D|nr:hypothetical protein [Undibacterium sp. KW1]BBB62758.1 hypothetical protein UNDKW_4485 [Undibacterium sp. KW1]